MTDTLRLIDSGRSAFGWSTIGLAFKCLQKYAWVVLLSAARENRAPLVRGSLGHVGMAHIWETWRLRQQKLPVDVYPWQDAMRQWCERHPDEGGFTFLDEMVETVRAWLAQNPEPPGRILAVEWVIEGVVGKGHRGIRLYRETDPVEFPTVGGSRVKISRRLDGLVEERWQGQSRIVIWDHKFRSMKFGDTTIQREYEADEQFSASREILRAWGIEAPVRINAVRVGAGKYSATPLLADASYLDERFAWRLWHKWDEIHRWLNVDPTWWPNSGDEQVCRGRYGDCAAKELCMFGRYLSASEK